MSTRGYIIYLPNNCSEINLFIMSFNSRFHRDNKLAELIAAYPHSTFGFSKSGSSLKILQNGNAFVRIARETRVVSGVFHDLFPSVSALFG